MKGKTLLVLIGITAAAIIVAAVMVRSAGDSGTGGIPQRVMPELGGRINDVAVVSVAKGDELIQLRWADGTWTVASKDGFPAKFEPLKGLLVGLADMKPLERKTSDPAMYARIGLGEPGAEGEGTFVRLEDRAGTPIATVVLGDRAPSGGRFVRVVGDPQTWLAETGADPRLDVLSWVDREVMRIPRERVERVTIEHPGQEPLVIAREGGNAFTIEGLAEDRKVKRPADLSQIAAALGYVGLSDVRAATRSPEDAVVTTFETSDGLYVVVTSWREGESTWATFDVSPAPAQEQATQTEAVQGEVADGEAQETGPGDASQKPGADEGQVLQAKLAGWAFELDSSKATMLRKTLEELTEAAPVPEAEGPEAPGGTPTTEGGGAP